MMSEKKVKIDAEVSQDLAEVSFKSFEEAKGKIQEILKNPEVKKKWMKKMKGNLFAFKSGKYVKVPLYCNNCCVNDKCSFYQEPKKGEFVVCALKNEFKKIIPRVNSRSREDLIESLYELLKIQVERLGRNYYFEFLNGGKQDKDLTMLIKSVEDTILKLIELIQPIEVVYRSIVEMIKSNPFVARMIQDNPRIVEIIQSNPNIAKIFQNIKSEKDLRELYEFIQHKKREYEENSIGSEETRKNEKKLVRVYTWSK